MPLGESLPRIDARAKVTGEALYPGDLGDAEVLHATVVFSDQPHARMLSMDTTDAEATEGVIAVFTAADVPVNEYGLTMKDQPVFVGVGGTGRSAVAADISRWEADHIALVVADSAEAARLGAERLSVEWELQPIVADIDDALSDDILVHAEAGTNLYWTDRIRKGDMAAGWAQADVIIEATYQVPHQEHAYLQPEAALSHVDDEGRITVHVAGQWTHEDQEQIAHALDLDPEQVRVIYPAIGGAFGGREDTSVQIVMALAAWRLAERGERRPVRIQWSREESIVGHHKRHRGRIRTRWGATAEGRITAVEALGHLDAGAYNYTTNKVLGNLHLMVAGPYEVPNAHIDSHAVYTHSVPGGAFRGFGGPQGAFVAETQMNKLAGALGIDPVEIRRRNLLGDASIGITQAEMPPVVTLREVVDECAAAVGWTEPMSAHTPIAAFASLPPAPGAVRSGRGFACAFKNVGYSFGFPERCEAQIVLHADDDSDEIAGVELHHAGADVGQGAHTAFVQMAAEAVGVDAERVRGVFSDTATSGDSGSSSASRMTWMAGNAILGAAEEADKAWRNGDRPAVGRFRFVPPTEALDPDTGRCQPNFAYGYVAQAVELSVDIETGHIVVHRVVNASDVGRVINRDLVVGQIEGAVVQANGYAITEDLQVSDGRVRNPRLSTYLIPGIGDIPEVVESVVLEHADPRGPWGVRGMAEMPFIPLAPAIIAALHDATGVWFDAFPLTPSRVLAGLRGGART